MAHAGVDDLDRQAEERERLAAAAGLPRNFSEARWWLESGRMTRAQYDAYCRVAPSPIRDWMEAHPGEPVTLRMIDSKTGKPQEPSKPGILDSDWLGLVIFFGAILLAAIGFPAL